MLNRVSWCGPCTGNNFGYGVPSWYGPYPPISYPCSTNRTLSGTNVPFSTIKPVFYGTVRTLTVRNTRVRLQHGYGTEKAFVPLGYVRTATVRIVPNKDLHIEGKTACIVPYEYERTATVRASPAVRTYHTSTCVPQ